MDKLLSLRTLLLLIVGGPLLVLLVIESFVSYGIGTNITNQVFDRWLLDSANFLVQELEEQDGTVRFIADDAGIKAFEWDEMDDIYYRISTSSGELIAGSSQLNATASIEELYEGPVFSDLNFNNQRTRNVSVLGPQNSVNPVIVTVAETLNKRQALIGELLFEVILSKIVLVLAVLIIISVAFGRGLKPLVRISRELKQRSPQELTPISMHRVPKELQGLIENTNRLLFRIEIAINSREQFIGNIAHQIRTPLAGMKLQAQLAQHEVDNPQVVHQALERIVHAADKMAYVNSQLMKLARAESAFGRGLRNEEVNLTAVIRNCCSELTGLAYNRNITILQSLSENAAPVPGDITLITEMIHNLIENAIIYGCSGGHVWVNLTTTDQEERIEIDDDGPGIAREHWPRIFDRFFRPVPDAGEGCGLGLSIVREIALAHGANVYLEERQEGTGTRFVIQFNQNENTYIPF